jgi:hypothetical protein
MQLPPGENSKSDHLAHTGSEIPQVSIARCPADIRNQMLFKSQPSDETTSMLLLVTDGPQHQ